MGLTWLDQSWFDQCWLDQSWLNKEVEKVVNDVNLDDRVYNQNQSLSEIISKTYKKRIWFFLYFEVYIQDPS